MRMNWLIVCLINHFFLLVLGTYYESTDFSRFRYCCWIGRRACFYWSWGWSRHCCGLSCRRDGSQDNPRMRAKSEVLYCLVWLLWKEALRKNLWTGWSIRTLICESFCFIIPLLNQLDICFVFDLLGLAALPRILCSRVILSFHSYNYLFVGTINNQPMGRIDLRMRH